MGAARPSASREDEARRSVPATSDRLDALRHRLGGRDDGNGVSSSCAAAYRRTSSSSVAPAARAAAVAWPERTADEAFLAMRRALALVEENSRAMWRRARTKRGGRGFGAIWERQNWDFCCNETGREFTYNASFLTLSSYLVLASPFFFHRL
jgi:hypothetical protein